MPTQSPTNVPGSATGRDVDQGGDGFAARPVSFEVGGDVLSDDVEVLAPAVCRVDQHADGDPLGVGKVGQPAVAGGAPAPIEPPEAATAKAEATMAVIDVRYWMVFTWFSYSTTHHGAGCVDGWLVECLGLEVDAGTC